MSERFYLLFGDEAEPYDKQEEYFPSFEDKYYLIDSRYDAIVFADGSYEAPEDNNLGRHYGKLIDLLNEVAAEKP